jgi:hypothetical protein
VSGRLHTHDNGLALGGAVCRPSLSLGGLPFFPFKKLLEPLDIVFPEILDELVDYTHSKAVKEHGRETGKWRLVFMFNYRTGLA